MVKNIDKYKEDLKKLLERALSLQLGFLKEHGRLDEVLKKQPELKDIKVLSFNASYESWYSESLVLIEQLLPNRLEDFTKLYKNDKRKEVDYLSYTISDALIGLRITKGYEVKTDSNAAFPKFQQQVNILQSIENRFESSLFEIQQLVQADIFDDELETSKELNKKGFYRAAGAICGVIIEKHLYQVCINHKIKLAKKHPTIADLNETLKNENVIEVKTWRFIQGLGDIRNLCSHNKEKEPTKIDIDDLIAGTERIIKTIS